MKRKPCQTMGNKLLLTDVFMIDHVFTNLMEHKTVTIPGKNKICTPIKPKLINCLFFYCYFS